MANHTVTLSTEEELALSVLIEEWTASQPETTWTPDLVLYTLVASDLHTRLRQLDERSRELIRVARGMTRAEYLPLIRQLSGAQKDRIRQLLGEA